MSRTLRDAQIQTRAARARLAVGHDHWRTLEPGALHIGYRKKAKDRAGKWLARRHIGRGRYRVVELGLADDLPGTGISYAEAVRAALAHIWDTPASKQRPGGMLVRDAIENYLRYLKIKGATARDAELRARTWILPKFGHRRISELTKTEIQDWLHWVASQPAKLRGGGAKARPTGDDGQRARRATANRTWTIFRAALNQAFNDDHVDDDTPWRKVKPFKKVDAARPGFLPVDESRRLLNACDPASGFRTLVRAGLESGCRYSELRRLKVSDFVAGKIHVAKSKTGKPRNVVLSEQGQRFFSQLAAGKASNDFLLVRGDGLPWSDNNQARWMRAACRAARIDPPITFQRLAAYVCKLECHERDAIDGSRSQSRSCFHRNGRAALRASGN